ncbi:MAG: hypothetical protein ABIA04_14400 [Pseudomonadota bacterium]
MRHIIIISLLFLIYSSFALSKQHTIDAFIYTTTSYYDNYDFSSVARTNEFVQSLALNFKSDFSFKKRHVSFLLTPTYNYYFKDNSYDPSLGDTSSLNGWKRLGNMGINGSFLYDESFFKKRMIFNLTNRVSYVPKTKYLSSEAPGVLQNELENEPLDLLSFNVSPQIDYLVNKKQTIKANCSYAYSRTLFMNWRNSLISSIPSPDIHNANVGLNFTFFNEKFSIGPKAFLSYSINNYYEDEHLESDVKGTRAYSIALNSSYLFGQSTTLSMALGTGFGNSYFFIDSGEWNNFISSSASINSMFYKKVFNYNVGYSRNSSQILGLDGLYLTQGISGTLRLNQERLPFIAKYFFMIPKLFASYQLSSAGDDNEIKAATFTTSNAIPIFGTLGLMLNYSYLRQFASTVSDVLLDPVDSHTVYVGLFYFFNIYGGKKATGLSRLPF